MAENIDNKTDLISLLKSRLKVAEVFAKKPHKAWKKWIAEYEIEDLDDTAEIRDKVRIGYIFRKTESELPAIFDDQPDLFIKGRSEKTRLIEPLIDGVYDYLWDTQNLEEKIEDAGQYFELLGMGFIKSPWVTKTKKVQEEVEEPMIDELGQPQVDPMTGQPIMQMGVKEYDVPVIDNPVAKAVNPFKLFFSPETEFGPVLDYEHCPYYFEQMTMTTDEIESRFGKKVDASEKLKIDEIDNDDKDEMETDSAYNKDDLKRVTVYEYYGCLPKNLAKGKNLKPWSYDSDYHIYLTKSEILQVEDCPYEIKPLFIIGNYGMANKFWKFGDAKHLKPLVDELQQYRSQILRHTRKMVNPKLLVEESMIVDENAIRNPLEGVTVKYQAGASGNKPEYLQAAPLGQEVRLGVELASGDLEKTSGSFDLAQGNSQSTVKSPRGIAVYAEAADKNVRRKRKKIARLIRQLLMFQFKQLSLFWNPDDGRVLEIVNPDSNEAEDVPVTQEVLEVLGAQNILSKLDIEIESLSINKVQMKQEALDLFDLAAQNPDVFDKMVVAKDLLQNGFGKRDADRFLASPEQQMQSMIASNPQLAEQILMQMQQQAAMQQQQGQAGAEQQAFDKTEANLNGKQQAEVLNNAQNMPPMPEMGMS